MTMATKRCGDFGGRRADGEPCRRPVTDGPCWQHPEDDVVRGRKPKPTHLKLLAGNRGKRPLNENEPKPERTVPDPPDHLDELARAKWDELAPRLNRLGLLTEIDGDALAMYCTAFSEFVENREKVQKHGSVVMTSKGNAVQSPYLGAANTAFEKMRKLLVEFGMTPSSRSRIEVPGHGDDENPFEQIG